MLPAAALARQESLRPQHFDEATADPREVDQDALVSGQGGYVSFYGRADGLRVGVFDLALGVSAPEFTGELVVAKLVEQLGLDAPDELAFARAAIDGVAQSAPAQRPTVRLEPPLTNGRERRVSYDNGRAKPAPPQASTLGLLCYALIDKVIARDGEGRRHSREPNQAENQMNLVAGPKVERIRKKYGAHPFARLSLASTRCLIEGAAGRFAGCRKKDRGRWKEEAEPEGQTALPSARGAAPFPIPKLAAQTLRTSRPLLRNAQPLEPLCASDQPSPLLPKAPLRRQGQRTSG